MDENQSEADESIRLSVTASGQASVNDVIPPADEADQQAGITDAYSGHGGSYVVDDGTQTRKPNK